VEEKKREEEYGVRGKEGSEGKKWRENELGERKEIVCEGMMETV